MPKAKKASIYPRRKSVNSADENGILPPVPGSCEGEPMITPETSSNECSIVFGEDKGYINLNGQRIELDGWYCRAILPLIDENNRNVKAKTEQIENIIQEFKREIGRKFLEVRKMDAEETQELLDFIHIRTTEVMEADKKDIDKFFDTDEKLQRPGNELPQDQKQRLTILRESLSKKVESLAASKASRYLALRENVKNDVILLEKSLLKMVSKEDFARLLKKNELMHHI